MRLPGKEYFAGAFFTLSIYLAMLGFYLPGLASMGAALVVWKKGDRLPKEA